MSKYRWIILAILLAFLGGYMTGRGWTARLENANAEKNAAQVRYLIALAYPRPDMKLFDNTPTASVMKDIEANKNAPQVVRSILMDQLGKDLEEWTKTHGNMKLPPDNAYWANMYLPAVNSLNRRLESLSAWEPGQTAPIKEGKP